MLSLLQPATALGERESCQGRNQWGKTPPRCLDPGMKKPGRLAVCRAGWLVFGCGLLLDLEHVSGASGLVVGDFRVACHQALAAVVQDRRKPGNHVLMALADREGYGAGVARG